MQWTDPLLVHSPPCIKCQFDLNYFFPENECKMRVYLGGYSEIAGEMKYIQPAVKIRFIPAGYSKTN